MAAKTRLDVYGTIAAIYAVLTLALILAVYSTIWLVDNWSDMWHGVPRWVKVIIIAGEIIWVLASEIIYQSGRHSES